ncbi:SgcJ/EcaC family oxidoreductase [Pseudomonas chlororaphis]|uniref:SgcJ/EcaC family oxidoreductase n=1 Tax=Pseudomonas chlororaphis TaxID=587753 RepID=UPI001E3BB0EF|nr:SgcJ/EcaC family oxidoreductase [Pseudomonas chlororaphis]MCB2255073.1 SgcJ/EcaC family oxidoreductase [Pseudomonas chlororaphis]
MKLKSTAITLLLTLAAPLAQALDATPYVYRTVAAQPQSQGDREIAGLFDRWNAALQSGSAKNVTSLYAADAILQPTVSNQVRTTPAQIQDYFEHFLAGKPVGQINYREIRHLGADAAMDSGVYTFTLHDAGGATRQVQARYTFLYERVDGQWKILNHHSSAMPQAQPQLQASHR